MFRNKCGKRFYDQDVVDYGRISVFNYGGIIVRFEEKNYELQREGSPFHVREDIPEGRVSGVQVARHNSPAKRSLITKSLVHILLEF